MKLAAAVMLMMATSVAQAAPEADVQRAWCAARGGAVEYVLPDGSRVDCLTRTHAVEVEHARRWAESVGQSLYYAMWTGRRAGVVLVAGRGDTRYLIRIESLVSHYGLPVDVWVVDHD